MNRTVGFSIGVIALTLSSLAYGVADSCDAFGYLSGAAGMESGDRFFHGTAKYDYFGQSVAMGDFDGDGAEDLLVGAPGADFAGSGSGAAYLFYGPISNGAKLNANTADVLFVGEGYNALAGSSVANAGDVDADGIDDILIGSVGGSGTPHPAGAAHLVLGGSMSGLVPLATGADAEFAGVATGDEFGSAVAGVGDVNGDGFADVAIGAPNQATAAGAGSGVTYVWYGPVGGLKAAASANFAAASAVSNAGVGTALAYVGDLNGDGYDDIVSGAPKSSAGGPSAGAAYLFLGGATLPATTTTASADASFVGDSYARAGASISAAGDQNGDGRDDFWVGAKQWGSLKKGAAYLLYGQPTLSGAYALESVFHAKLAGEDSNDLAGSSIAGNVDFDGDGTPDVLVGGERGDFGAVQSGAAWVVHGPFDGTINLGSADAKIGGAAYLDYAGHAVAAGDLNGDGFDDAMVGAWQAQNAAGGLARQGQVTSFFGGHDVEDLQTYYADADADGYGNAATGIPSCSAVAGRVLSDTDCNDASASYHPGATEACAGPDTNCDGFIGNIDHDGDGVTACGGDCDDGSAAIKPSADEVCGDSIDNDCDELIDDGTSVDAVVYSPDADGDGYGNTALTVRACQDPGTFLTSVVHVDGDCDDADTAIRPDASERCDLVDNNCDSLTDDASSIDAATWFADDDSDSYGNYWDSAKGCSQPPGYVANEADCDDADPNIKPGASEVCDFGDNDCDGVKYLGGPVSVSQNRAAVQGYGQSDDFGEAITFLGDQNGDGYDEIVIGAPRNDADGGDDRGAVFIQRGSSAGGDYDLAQPFADGAPRWNVRIRGVRNLGRVGSTLTHGDINGDGTDDLIIGANYAPVPGQQTGAVYVFFGPIADGDYDVNAASLILKGSATGDLFGSAIAAGDVDGDGLDDIIASAPGFGTNNNGRVYLVYGNAAMAGELFVNAVPGLAHFTGGASSDELGSGLSIVDLDADGYGDIVIGAGFVGGLDAGAVMVRYGQSTRFSGAVTPTATITGTSDRDKLGLSVANVHDVNNDGFDDLLVGSDNNTAYLFWGGGTRLASNTVNTAASFLFHGLTNQGAAESVAGAGDVDGDGYDDMIISAVRDDDGGSNAGGTYIVYGNTHAYFDAVDSAKIIDLGKTESFGRIAAGDLDNFPTYSASNLGGVEGAKITGLAASDLLGSSVAGGGDFNGDGRPDVAMGATQV
ncbi:MAG TPA: MopE-related protein, partial [Myxococcota bacterium]|nr:MopE-related protein [Myxococcota bacterium]